MLKLLSGIRDVIVAAFFTYITVSSIVAIPFIAASMTFLAVFGVVFYIVKHWDELK